MPKIVKEAYRLFHPGSKAKIGKIDKYGFWGRDPHPPTDGSLEGHHIRVTNYVDTEKKYGIEGGREHEPRYQAVKGQVLTGPHKGKEFTFIGFELSHI